MQNDRPPISGTKSLLFPLLLVGSILLNACATPQIPHSAVDVLNAYWGSLPGGATQDLTIVRAWPGKTPSGNSLSMSDSMEIWCVETRLSNKPGVSNESDSMLWIVTRSSKDAEWESAPLMIMSSTWPYQACGGVGP